MVVDPDELNVLLESRTLLEDMGGIRITLDPYGTGMLQVPYFVSGDVLRYRVQFGELEKEFGNRVGTKAVIEFDPTDEGHQRILEEIVRRRDETHPKLGYNLQPLDSMDSPEGGASLKRGLAEDSSSFHSTAAKWGSYIVDNAMTPEYLRILDKLENSELVNKRERDWLKHNRHFGPLGHAFARWVREGTNHHGDAMKPVLLGAMQACPISA